MSRREPFRHVILSRTDRMGDVVLALPVAGALKKFYPRCRITFLGRAYTKPIIDACEHIDEFLDRDQFAAASPANAAALMKRTGADAILHLFPDFFIATLSKRAGIRLRVGTNRRFYHWLTCNRLVNLSRRRSRLHEAQLNLKLLRPFGIRKNFPPDEIPALYGLTRVKPLAEDLAALLSPAHFNLILHPSSSRSAREWGMENYVRLAGLLPEHRFRIFLTGSGDGSAHAAEFFARLPHVSDLTGRFSGEELLSFIAAADGIVAASTGPLHIAAALGKHAVGLYAPIRPMHPGRWAPLGKNATFLALKKSCSKCRHSSFCACIRSITPQEVKELLMRVLMAAEGAE